MELGFVKNLRCLSYSQFTVEKSLKEKYGLSKKNEKEYDGL